MSLAHYIEGGKLAGERAGSELGRPQAWKLSIRILQTVGAGCAGVATRARSHPSPRFLKLSESKNDTCRVAEAVLASVGFAEEPGGQRIRGTEVGAQVIDLGGTDCEVATQADINAPTEGHRERGRAGHAAGYSANNGKADSPTEIRTSLAEQSMTKDGGPTEARRGCWAEQKVVHTLIGGDRDARQQ